MVTYQLSTGLSHLWCPRFGVPCHSLFFGTEHNVRMQAQQLNLWLIPGCFVRNHVMGPADTAAGASPFKGRIVPAADPLTILDRSRCGQLAISHRVSIITVGYSCGL